jgi:glycosyltransferase involved in cell wall biosynthesis
MTQTPPIVSVLMTVYNREKYLAEAIESVIASSYQTWELIIVDDRSQDNSVLIAKNYAFQDDRIKVFVNEKNLGDYPNRNMAASYAQGKYLKYLDADDIIYPHALDVFVRDIEKYPTAAIALCKPDNPTTPLPVFLNSRNAIREHFLDKSLFTNSPLGTIISKEAFEKVNGFSGKRYIGDTELWIKIANHYDVVKTVMGLGFWRSHESQESKNETLSIDGIFARYNLDRESLAYSKSYFTQTEYEKLNKAIDKKYNRVFLSLIKTFNFSRAFQFKRKLNLSFLKIIRNLF